MRLLSCWSNSHSHLRGTLFDLPPPPHKRRIVFILRQWACGCDEPVWIGEVQDVPTGETIHVQGLEALFELLRQKINQRSEPPEKKALQ
jgi:hypothetical protein